MKKLFKIAIVVFLLLALPAALFLSRQRQEIRKKAAGNAFLAFSNENPSVGSPVTATLRNVPEGTVWAYGKIILPSKVAVIGTLIPDAVKPLDAIKVNELFRTYELYGGAQSASEPFSGNLFSVTFTINPDAEGIQTVQYQLTTVDINGTVTTNTGLKNDATFTVQGAATTTPTATPVVTMAPTSARIILGTPTRSGNNLAFPINYEAGANPSTIGLSVHYDTSKLTYVSTVKGGSFNNLQFYGTDGAGSDKKLNFGVSGFITSSTSKHAATVNFTLNSGVQSASVWLIKTELSMAGFTNINCTPISGTTCTQTYSPTTPTPTATPTATPVITPTATPGGTSAPLAISNLTSTLNNSTVAKPTPNVRISFDTNLLTTASLVLKLPNGDIYGPSPAPSNLGVFGFPVNPPNRNYVTDDSVFKHTAAVVHHNFDVGSLISGTYYYKVWAAAGSQLVSNPGAQYNSFTVGVGPTPTATLVVPATCVVGEAGDPAKCDGHVGITDLALVYDAFRTSCATPNYQVTPVVAMNGDFNQNGCVDLGDVTTLNSRFDSNY